MEKFLNLIFIPECIFCKKEGTFFCPECMASCRKPVVPFIDVKKFPIKFIFGYEYERFIRECIRTAKYRNKYFAALKVLSEEVVKELKPSLVELQNGETSIILPIPVTVAKMAKRGFNQAEIIAQKFSQELQMSLKTNILIRAKETVSQYSIDKRKRFENLKNAFEIKNQQLLEGKTVLVIDDVCTTGATFLEASKILLKSGARQVICISIARKSLIAPS